MEQHYQNRANTAGSYYKGKPGPEDHAPQPLSTGNPGSIPYSKSHAQVAWPGEKKKTTKKLKQLGLCPSAFSLTGLQQRQPHSRGHKWTSDKS